MPFSATLIEPYKAPAPSQVTEVKREPLWHVKVMVLGHDWNTRTQFAEYATNSKVPRFGDCNFRMQFYGHEVSIDLRVRQDSFEDSFGKATYRGHDAVIYTVTNAIRKTLDKVEETQKLLIDANALDQVAEVLAVKFTENISFNFSQLKEQMTQLKIANYVSFTDDKPTPTQQNNLFKLLLTEIFEKQITTIHTKAPKLNIELLQYHIAKDRFIDSLEIFEKRLAKKALNHSEQSKIQTALDSAKDFLDELAVQEKNNSMTDYKMFIQLFEAANTFFKKPSTSALNKLTNYTNNHAIQILSTTAISVFAASMTVIARTFLGFERNAVSFGAALATGAATFFGSQYIASKLFANKADQFISAIDRIDEGIIKKLSPNS